VLLTSNEAVTVGANVLGASFVSIGALSVTTSVTVTDVSGAASGKAYLLQFGTTGQLPPSADLTAATAATITLNKGAIKDAAGNSPSANPSATIATDSTAPSIGAASVSHSATSTVAVIAKAPLKFTAVNVSGDGTLWGARANSYQLDVNNVRGLVLPTVSIDASTKTITVTADTSYHTVADIAAAYADTGDGDWSVGATTGDTSDTLNPTVANATVLTADGVAGVSNVRIRVTSSEPTRLAATGYSASISDLIAGTVTKVSVSPSVAYAAAVESKDVALRTSIVISTTSIGTGTLTFLSSTDGLYDMSGNRFSGSVNFTVS